MVGDENTKGSLTLGLVPITYFSVFFFVKNICYMKGRVLVYYFQTASIRDTVIVYEKIPPLFHQHSLFSQSNSISFDGLRFNASYNF